ncbi:MAG: hypothetical protein JO348_04925 [Alphaproteobacteria bacterium]|nr:hypothetical protein [Alphaproteobacteria bacterium]MBV9419096.1 hypothetical protein [Alphaproteobacteria bacterium]MBV9540391.1 hypothetical protein [Alphaproteobacteria bacterium]
MNLDDRIRQQFPGLIVTLLSVLIGLALSDLVGLARTRMTLWPLDVSTLRTWGEALAMVGCCLSVWVIFAHMAISRQRTPKLTDSAVVFVIPATILFGNSLVGQPQSWPWFYFASFYLLVSLVTWHWQVHIALAERELAPFARLTRPLGPLAVIYFGIPFYAVAGWADSHGYLSPVAQMVVALTGGPAALITAGIFVNEWHRAIAQAERAVQPVAT